MILLNRRYTAEEAVAIGLANRAVEPEKLMPEALAMAEEIAAGPGPMLSMSKVMMKRAYEASVEEFFEREAIAQASPSAAPSSTKASRPSLSSASLGSTPKASRR